MCSYQLVSPDQFPCPLLQVARLYSTAQYVQYSAAGGPGGAPRARHRPLPRHRPQPAQVLLAWSEETEGQTGDCCEDTGDRDTVVISDLNHYCGLSVGQLAAVLGRRPYMTSP